MADNTASTSPDVGVANAAVRNDKRERKHTAQSLPPGITHNMMKKFVVYYREMMYLKNGKTQPREYFKVESHPRLKKPWVSSKSVKISLIEKLNDANQVVADLEEHDIYPSGYETTDVVPTTTTTEPAASDSTLEHIVGRLSKYLPKYTSLRIIRNTTTLIILSLIYDRKDTTNGFRWTASNTFSLNSVDMTIIEMSISHGIQHLRDKITNKYGADLLCV